MYSYIHILVVYTKESLFFYKSIKTSLNQYARARPCRLSTLHAARRNARSPFFFCSVVSTREKSVHAAHALPRVICSNLHETHKV